MPFVLGCLDCGRFPTGPLDFGAKCDRCDKPLRAWMQAPDCFMPKAGLVPVTIFGDSAPSAEGTAMLADYEERVKIMDELEAMLGTLGGAGAPPIVARAFGASPSYFALPGALRNALGWPACDCALEGHNVPPGPDHLFDCPCFAKEPPAPDSGRGTPTDDLFTDADESSARWLAAMRERHDAGDWKPNASHAEQLLNVAERFLKLARAHSGRGTGEGPTIKSVDEFTAKYLPNLHAERERRKAEGRCVECGASKNDEWLIPPAVSPAQSDTPELSNDR